YDNQKISLPYGGAISKDFATLLVLQDSQGETVFADENNPSYAYACHLNRDGRELMVDSATFGEDNKLMAVSYSVTNGALGNIRQGELKNAICDKGIKVIANTNGSGGTDGATVAELKEKLATMLRNPAVPVTEEDYESFTRRIPGLCIDLVSAYCDGDNIVKIAVKPVSEEKFPHLGRVYKKAIEDYLEKVKLITTAIAVIEPVYLPIDVYLTVHTKPYAVNAEAIIKNALSQKLDYYKSGCGFGSILLYNGLYSCIEQLDCVEYIERLTVEADSSYKEAIVDGNDIRLGKSVLPYLRKSEIRQVLRV
ncbi:MAG: baseplate J/gp47 family protein, partial [Oscillospiraceae bacterium]